LKPTEELTDGLKNFQIKLPHVNLTSAVPAASADLTSAN
jgi:hypothetical protein